MISSLAIIEVSLITWIDILAIILSFVSLIITTVGFFASLRFYRDGVNLQQSANSALTKLEEKTQFIQTQVGGMFQQTLDAAIGKRELVSENFADLKIELEETKARIVEESLSEIGAAGEQERKRITEIVDREMEGLRQKVKTAEVSAEAASELNGLDASSKLRILNVMGLVLGAFERAKGEPALALSLSEIQTRSGVLDAMLLRHAIVELLEREFLYTIFDPKTGEQLYKRRLDLTLYTDGRQEHGKGDET